MYGNSSPPAVDKRNPFDVDDDRQMPFATRFVCSSSAAHGKTSLPPTLILDEIGAGQVATTGGRGRTAQGALWSGELAQRSISRMALKW
jgi:hypothetical protein